MPFVGDRLVLFVEVSIRLLPLRLVVMVGLATAVGWAVGKAVRHRSEDSGNPSP